TTSLVTATTSLVPATAPLLTAAAPRGPSACGAGRESGPIHTGCPARASRPGCPPVAGPAVSGVGHVSSCAVDLATASGPRTGLGRRKRQPSPPGPTPAHTAARRPTRSPAAEVAVAWVGVWQE